MIGIGLSCPRQRSIGGVTYHPTENRAEKVARVVLPNLPIIGQLSWYCRTLDASGALTRASRERVDPCVCLHRDVHTLAEFYDRGDFQLVVEVFELCEAFVALATGRSSTESVFHHH